MGIVNSTRKQLIIDPLEKKKKKSCNADKMQDIDASVLIRQTTLTKNLRARRWICQGHWIWTHENWFVNWK